MVPECRHIKTSGGKCGSPALRGQSFCYFHSRLKQRAAEPEPTFILPNLEDRGAVQLAINEVVKALAAHKLNAKRAGLLLYALQIASANARNKEEIVCANSVDEVTRDEQGEEMAPEGFTSRPPERETIGMFLMREFKEMRKQNQELSPDQPAQPDEAKDFPEK